MNKGVAAAADKGLPFWHDKALTAVKVVALYFSYRPTVEFFKDTIGLELTDTALCAIFVSIIYAAACSLPFEYVMIQIQKMQPDAEGKYPYTGFLDCAVKTYKAGGILKFYTGFPLYCVRISFGVMMACIAINNLGDGRKFAGALFATTICVAACSLPFEYVMTQLQKMQPDAEGKYPYTSFLDCAVKTFKAEGALKFYTGFPLYCARMSPRVVMTCFFVHEFRKWQKNVR